MTTCENERSTEGSNIIEIRAQYAMVLTAFIIPAVM
jgi:hypothetical protein